jgi:hypothetical protein
MASTCASPGRSPSPSRAALMDKWTMKSRRQSVPGGVLSKRAGALQEPGSAQSPSPSRGTVHRRPAERVIGAAAPGRTQSMTASGKAAALGGVGPRHARRPEAADRWPPVAPSRSLVTERALAAPMKHPAVSSRSRVGRESALAGGRGRTGGTPARQPAPIPSRVVTRTRGPRGDPPRQPRRSPPAAVTPKSTTHLAVPKRRSREAQGSRRSTLWTSTCFMNGLTMYSSAPRPVPRSASATLI